MIQLSYQRLSSLKVCHHRGSGTCMTRSVSSVHKMTKTSLACPLPSVPKPVSRQGAPEPPSSPMVTPGFNSSCIVYVPSDLSFVYTTPGSDDDIRKWCLSLILVILVNFVHKKLFQSNVETTTLLSLYTTS